jgi:hypothetical protein
MTRVNRASRTDVFSFIFVVQETLEMKNVGKALIISLSLAGSAMLAPIAANAQVEITVAPPAPQVEVVPAPRVGYVWAPGYWDWRGGRHVWVGGTWVHERPGYHWVPSHWDQHGDHYRFARGHWER